MTLWLRERFGWMGSHSGYDQLCEAISDFQTSDHCSSIWREPGKPLPKGSKRILRYFSKNSRTSPFYDLHSAAAELSALWSCWRQKYNLVHITYAENNLGFLPNFKHSLAFKLVATAHQPASWWRLMHSYPKSVANLNALIVLSQREVSYFEEFLGDRVHFIPHGVDTEFFHPAEFATLNSAQPPRCVFSGTWLRDLQTLAHVIDQVLAKNPSIQFDMIVPRSKRKDPFFYRIARHDQVRWHTDISDEQLRSVYQQASILFLPLLDCTANNAILEATACGLPILSNAVGGLTHYTQPTFAQLLPIGDVNGFTTTILELVDNQAQLQASAKAARSFAEQYLDWKHIAQKTLDIYHHVANEDSLI